MDVNTNLQEVKIKYEILLQNIVKLILLPITFIIIVILFMQNLSYVNVSFFFFSERQLLSWVIFNSICFGAALAGFFVYWFGVHTLGVQFAKTKQDMANLQVAHDMWKRKYDAMKEAAEKVLVPYSLSDLVENNCKQIVEQNNRPDRLIVASKPAKQS